MYRALACTTRALLVGVCLWVVRKELGDRPPTLADYAAEHGISPDTIRRAGRALLRPVLACLRGRRPGPQKKPRREHTGTIEASLACLDLLQSLLPAPLVELASSPHKRGMVAQVAKHWVERGVPLQTLAGWLSLSQKTLRRWIRRLDKHEAPHQSRRPHTSPRQLPAELQRALFNLRQALPDLSVAELTRVFVRKFSELLLRHGRTTISQKTVARYVATPPTPDGTGPAERESPRGGYRYPPPLAMAWIDTTYFEVAGTTVHIVAAMEASSRVALAGEAFVQENAATTVDVLSRALVRVPELCAVLRDRGRPYLNAEVNEMLGAKDVIPIDAHPYFPIDKAALERFFRWLKEWLSYALALYEKNCRCEGRTPTRDEVVAMVHPALRACLRAYNLLPQPFLEENSPIERMDWLLRADGDPGFSIGDLRRLAVERETKDDLLEQVRDGLQLDRKPLARIRADFARISRAALRNALDTVGNKLFVIRDRAIKRPYGYLLAVAKLKEREHQRSCAQKVRVHQDERERRVQNDAIDEALRNEEDQRRHRPEEVLTTTLQDWAKAIAGPIRATRRYFSARLAEVLVELQRKLGTAFSAQLAAVHSSLPTLAAEIRPDDAGLSERLRLALMAVLERTNELQAAGGRLPSETPASFASNQVRGSPEGPPDTHVSGTDVSP